MLTQKSAFIILCCSGDCVEPMVAEYRAGRVGLAKRVGVAVHVANYVIEVL
jgi:hypothetical protein